MDELLSLREFSARTGKSHVWVLKLIQRGIIPRDAETGKIPAQAGLRAYEDYLRARPPATPKKEKQAKQPKKEKQPKKAAPPEAEDDGDDEIAELHANAASAAKVSSAFNKAKLAEKTYQAKLKELEYKLKKGELLERAEVASEAAALADAVKSQLLAVPPRISSMCEGRAAREIEEIITDGINEALKTLQNMKFEG